MRKIKKAKIFIILIAILMCISNTFAIKYMDVEVRVTDTGKKLIGFLIREDKKREYFWSCSFEKKHSKGKIPKQIKTFFGKIDGLSIPETSSMYKLIEKACLEYDELRDADPGLDFQKGIIYLFDYSPNNKHFKTIIKSLQKLSGCYFNLNLLNSLTIR